MSVETFSKELAALTAEIAEQARILRGNAAEQYRSLLAKHADELAGNAVGDLFGGSVEPIATGSPKTGGRAPKKARTDKPAAEKRPRTAKSDMIAREDLVLEYAGAGTAFALGDAASYLQIDKKYLALTIRSLVKKGYLVATGTRRAARYSLGGKTNGVATTVEISA
jgi:hypothetical protein